MASHREDVAFSDQHWPSLRLALGARRSAWLASTCLAVYYSVTMSRDLALYDSGELSLAAYQLGLGHPPGQPLHTLLGFVFARMPFASALFGINLLSALPAALTLIPCVSLAQTLAGNTLGSRARTLLPWLVAVCGLHEALWEPATRVEVYALATLCATWALARVLPSFVSARQPPSAASVFEAGVALGLCACANPVIALATGVAIFPALLHATLRGLFPWPVFARAIGGGVIGLLPYAYLPLVAARQDVMIWGGLDDAASYVRYLTLRDYALNQSIDAATWLAHAAAWFERAGRHLLLPVLVFGIAGHVRASYRVPTARALLPLAFGLLLAFISFNVVWHLDVPDYNGYLATAYWLAIAGAAALAATALQARRWGAAASVAACLTVCVLASPGPTERTRQRDRLARVLAEHVLHEAPPHAIVIALADHFAGTLFYLQEAEHQRPDVIVLADGLTGSSWHWRHLQRLHPDLRPVALRGPGGRAGRIQRWLAANAERPVLVERILIARELGLRACPGGLYLRTGALCDQSNAPDPTIAPLMAAQLRSLGDGAPSAAGAIADVTLNLGEALWRLGYGREAHDVLLAGVPELLGPRTRAAAARLAQAKPLQGSLPSWQRTAALGDPARNLFLAGVIASASGEQAAATRYIQAAAQNGLPEARAAVTELASRSAGVPP